MFRVRKYVHDSNLRMQIKGHFPLYANQIVGGNSRKKHNKQRKTGKALNSYI